METMGSSQAASVTGSGVRGSGITGVPGTMRAAVYCGIDDVRVEAIAVPEIGPGEVLVRINTCGICGTDLKKIHTGSHPAPRVFGHRNGGDDCAGGRGGDSLSGGGSGDGLPTTFLAESATSAARRRSRSVRSTSAWAARRGFRRQAGGFAEYIRVMDWIVDGGLVKIPEDIPFEQACFPRAGEHVL